MSERSVALDLAGLARLDQVLLGLLDESGLPLGDRYLDEEGTPVATRNDGQLVGLREPRWVRPEGVRGDPPVVVATAGLLPAAELPDGVLVLLPIGGVRPDDVRVPAWSAAWTTAATNASGQVVTTPVEPGEATSRASAVAAAYSS